MQLTTQQIELFFDQGYILLPEVFSQEEIADLSAAFDRLLQPAKDLPETSLVSGSQYVVERGVLQRVVWAPGREPSLLKHANDPRLTGPASQLLGSSELNQIISQAHYKLPGDGVSYPWHQDSSNRGYGTPDWTDLNQTGSYVQTIIAIDEMGPDNGPLQFIPKSCRFGHLDEASGEIGRGISEHGFEELHVRPGSVIMFGPYTVHGSGPNNSNRPRRVFINGFAYPGANSRIYPGCGTGHLIKVEKRHIGP